MFSIKIQRMRTMENDVMHIDISIPTDWQFTDLHLRFDNATGLVSFNRQALEQVMSSQAFAWLMEDEEQGAATVIGHIWAALGEPEDHVMETLRSQRDASYWTAEQFSEHMRSELESSMRI